MIGEQKSNVNLQSLALCFLYSAFIITDFFGSVLINTMPSTVHGVCLSFQRLAISRVDWSGLNL